MKKLIFIVIAISLFGTLVAQNQWEFTFDVKGILNQSYYTDNWSGEEESNINWITQGNMRANRQITDWFKSMNSLKLKFGQIYDTKKDENNQQKPGWEDPRKSDDEIDLLSLGLFTLDGWVDPYASLRVQTVFEGNKLRALNPLRFSQGIGAAKTILDFDRMGLEARLGLSLRQLHEYRKTTMVDGGFEFITEFMYIEPLEKAKFTSTVQLFQALYNSEDDDLPNDYWKTLDIEWTNEVSIQVYKYLSFNVYSQLLYDKEIDRTGRFKQTSGLGLTYKLF